LQNWSTGGDKESHMALRLIARDSCDGPDGCPTVYASSGQDVVVQGYDVDGTTLSELRLPTGENAVRLPGRLIIKAALRLILAGILRRLTLMPRRLAKEAR
jgi:hypothetical protein